MNDPVTQEIVRIIETSADREEMERRIIANVGSNMLVKAYEHAKEIKHRSWFSKTVHYPEYASGDFRRQQEEADELLSCRIQTEAKVSKSQIARRGLNVMQQRALLIIAIVFFAMLLYPPFNMVLREGTFSVGYGWIHAPPRPGATVNGELLITQWLGVAAVGIATYYIFKK